MNDAINAKLKLLGWYQVVGALIGYGMMIWLALHVSYENLFIVFILLIAAALYTLSLVAGIRVLKSKEKGLNLSLTNQWLQVFGFAAGGYAAKYISGIAFVITINISPLMGAGFFIGPSTFQLTVNTGTPATWISINIFAIVVIGFIYRLRKKIRDLEVVLSFEEQDESSIVNRES